MRVFKITAFSKFFNNKQKIYGSFRILNCCQPFLQLDSADVANGVVSSSEYNQNSEKEDRGTVNTKKAEKIKLKAISLKRYFSKGQYTFTHFHL